MAATLEAVPSTKSGEKKTEISKSDAARELVRMVKEQGLSLTGPDALLKQLTKTVIEIALDEEMAEHLGYEKRDTAGKQTANPVTGCAREPNERLALSIPMASASAVTSAPAASQSSDIALIKEVGCQEAVRCGLHQFGGRVVHDKWGSSLR